MEEKPNWLFTAEIVDVASWVAVYQDIEAFEPLIRQIAAKHSLPCGAITNLTPGSNAVFQVGKDMVIKLFAPPEAGFSNPKAFEIEVAAMTHANRVAASPRLIQTGAYTDKYTFHYLIMEKVAGEEFIQVPIKQRMAFVPAIKQLMKALHVTVKEPKIPQLTRQDCLENVRWAYFPDTFCEERLTIIRSLSFDDLVYVHGDLKAANLILKNESELYVIDFADSHLALREYDWPYLVFGVFGCNQEMMTTYFGDYKTNEFIETLSNSILMHKFGAFLLLQLCELRGIDEAQLSSVGKLHQLVEACLNEGDTVIT